MKVKVSAKAERFRRAGLEFTREPQEIEIDEKTYKALSAEPMLAVEVLDDGDGNETKTKKGGK